MLASDADATIESIQGPSLALDQGTVAPAGDVDGDGTIDVIVGANEERTDYSYEGRAYLVDGTRLDEGAVSLVLADWKLEGVTPNESVGWQVVPAGDPNADGHADVLVSAPDNTEYGSNGGAVFLFQGPLSGSDGPSDHDAAFFGSTSMRVGYAMLPPSELTGDGMADMVFSAPMTDRTGAVFIVPATGF
jgi:hypothetical protein